MKPVLILQHMDDGGPGLFCRFSARSRRAVRGAAARPRGPGSGNPDRHSVFRHCLCGGVQGANDPLPWLADEMALVRNAARLGLPVIGHCLGGQFISKAMGGIVRQDLVTEFGWQPLRSAGTRTRCSRRWSRTLNSARHWPGAFTVAG